MNTPTSTIGLGLGNETVPKPSTPTAAEDAEVRHLAEVERERAEASARHTQVVKRMKAAAEARKGREDEEHQQEREFAEEARHEYPASNQASFIAGCTAQGSSESDCHCVLVKLEKRLSLAQFEGLNEGVRAQVPLPKYVNEYREACGVG
jgi:hypothetical protein